MEVSGMNSAYADYLTSQASSARTTALQSKLNGSETTTATDEEMKEACKEFEAYFIEQVFNAMMETTKVFSDEENTYASKMVDCFKDTAVQQLCDQATDGGGLGLANMLYEQMKIQNDSSTIKF